MPTQVMAVTIDLGVAIPATAGQSRLVSGDANLTNAPTATGVLTNPQAPSGTSVTNTTRTLEATQTYMAASLNKLNVGTTPPPAKN